MIVWYLPVLIPCRYPEGRYTGEREEREKVGMKEAGLNPHRVDIFSPNYHIRWKKKPVEPFSIFKANKWIVNTMTIETFR